MTKMRTALLCSLLLSYTVYVAAQPHYEADYGPEAVARRDKEAREKDPNLTKEDLKDPNDCQNFGPVGQCSLICSYIQDVLINGQDDTVQFETDLSKLNITSPDSIYTTCDPLSGDILEYTTGKIIKNIEDLRPSLVAKFAPLIPQNTTCGDWDDVGLCMTMCDYISDTLNYKGSEYYVVNLKAYQLFSNDGPTTLCDPDDGNIYDHSRPNQLLASFRELDIKPKNRTVDSDGNRMPLWANANRVGALINGRRLMQAL